MNNVKNEIAKFMNCNENEIIDISFINKGLTNFSYVFTFNNCKYVFRIPKKYFNFLVDRKREFEGQVLAKEYGFDTSFIKLDINTGYKLTKFIENSHNHLYTTKEEIPDIIKFLHNLHNSKKKPSYFFDPFIHSERIINELEKYNAWDISKNDLRNKLKILYDMTKNDNVEPCFSHCDALADNYMINNDNGHIEMIDWEYSAIGDPAIDLGCYISDGDLSREAGIDFIKEYLSHEFNKYKDHYIIYTALISWFWACDVNYRIFSWPNDLKTEDSYISLIKYDDMLYSVSERFSYL